MDNDEEQFQKGFNNGYLMAKHEPTLIEKIIEHLKPSDDFTDGLVSGKEEYSKEKLMNNSKSSGITATVPNKTPGSKIDQTHADKFHGNDMDRPH